MAIRNIIQVGDPTLRKKSFAVTEITDKTRQLLDDMKETLIRANGAGLAAPQVGVLRRIFIVMVDEGYFEFINPEIIKKSGKQVGPEGCLSVKRKQGDVERPSKVVVKAQNRSGEWFMLTAYDFFAKAICHEYDHLDGILYIDIAKNIVEVAD